ncbi:MAG: tRNA (guanosine(46)-N7)-methyltransferase TrmB [Rhodobiaceae bacterium]|nr:tRNA (guanosine(46)-N7)-methyltransferase TrmB [Rhodobiaceae bacterium]
MPPVSIKTPGEARPSRIHGRRSGHALRQGQRALMQDLLPGLKLDLGGDARHQALLAAPQRALWLEIGFGGGEHLAFQAANNPDTGFIGCEPFINGIAKLLARIARDGLGNIRLHDGDARELLAWLPDQSLDRVFILYPDPWPKRRHWKRRIVGAETVVELARAMKPGSQLRIASDIDDYIDWILRHVLGHGAFAWTARTPSDWRMPPPDWTRTRYEAKALREGRKPAYLTFLRR